MNMGFETPNMDQHSEVGGERYSPKTGDQVHIDGMKDEPAAEVIGIAQNGKVLLRRHDQSTVEIERERLIPADAEAGSVDMLGDEDVERDVA
jgi:hypothetical protein